MSTDTAYVVTSGIYSAYKIERVFLTPEEVTTYLETGRVDKSEEANVELWPTSEAGYYTGQLYAAAWQKRPTSSFTNTIFPGFNINDEDWHDDPAFPTDKVKTWSRWQDYDGVRPMDIEVHGGVNTRDYYTPEVTVMVVGYDKARVDKVLSDEVAAMKAKLLEMMP